MVQSEILTCLKTRNHTVTPPVGVLFESNFVHIDLVSVYTVLLNQKPNMNNIK